MMLFFYTQVTEHCSSIAFCVPAVHFCKQAFQFTCLYTVFFAKVFFGIDSVLSLHHIIQCGVTADHRFQHRYLVKLVVVLFQHTHAQSL